MTTMVCPKCAAEMRTYERNGVTVEQCTDCRGLFLDRGELERLVAAENAWSDSSAARPAAAQASPTAPAGYAAPVRAYEPPRRYDDDDDDRRGYDQYGRPRRKKSFLSELFD